MAFNHRRIAVAILAALTYAGLEAYIHIACGVKEDMFESEMEECVQLPAVGDFLYVTETLCRAGMAVFLAGTLWELAVACGRGEGMDYLRDHMFSEFASVSFIVSVIWALFTGAIRFIDMFSEAELPFWVDVYIHIFEIFCAASVTAAIAGFIYDVIAAAVSGTLIEFLAPFVCCNDSLEGHGLWDMVAHVPGTDDQVEVEEPQSTSCLRALLLWSVFLFIIIFRMLGYWEAAPEWAELVMDVVGGLCSAFLALGFIQGLFHMSATVSFLSGRFARRLGIVSGKSEQSEPLGSSTAS
eukprot:TRINITY_DN6110_c0_g2_i1.p1 TRINITY_DN6110_c0_g2~~TRINITY_DN6110_c0_g2_i1.p1  ORF type:complete len:297 (-),score=54.94 TRINITY_DN6110_c0_g2_i1:60-950(-)